MTGVIIVARVGAVVVTTSARTGVFQKKMKRAGRSVRRFSKTAAVAARRVAKLGAGMAAIGAGGLVLMTRQSMKNIDSLAKMSDKIGITTRELGRMHLAARLTGVETKTFDMALQRMTRRLSEAAAGGGEAVAAIKELGLDAKKLSAMGPAQAFKAIAAAMESVESQGDRVRLAFKLFDSEGVSLVNTLALGAKGLEDIARKADRYGVALSRADAAKIEMANDAILEAKQLIIGLGNELAVRLSPYIRSVVNRFIEWGVSGRTAGELVQTALDGVITAIGWTADAFFMLPRTFLQIKGGILGTLHFVEREFWQFTAGISQGMTQLLIDMAQKWSWIPGIGNKLKGAAFTSQLTTALLDSNAEAANKRFVSTMNEIEAQLKAFDAKVLPSTRITNWFNDIADAAQEAADAIAASKLNIKGVSDIAMPPARAMATRSLGPRFAQAYETNTAASYRATKTSEWGGMRDPTVKAVESMHDTLERVMREQQRATQELRAIKEGQAQTISMD